MKEVTDIFFTGGVGGQYSESFDIAIANFTYDGKNYSIRLPFSNEEWKDIPIAVMYDINMAYESLINKN